MSEAILFALDAPHVTDLAEALAFVEENTDSQAAPSAHLASFFAALVQTWPEDGSNGGVWHEDFTHNPPSGPVLEMCFELNVFDEALLEDLKTLAAQHGIHVLDAEGEVLYLADGSEATA